eukprot:COSAG06_NODE_9170_length_1968_cov_4.178170_3_plen_54_part_01
MRVQVARADEPKNEPNWERIRTYLLVFCEMHSLLCCRSAVVLSEVWKFLSESFL